VLPLARVLERAAIVYGHRLAIVDGDVRLSYRELAERVAKLAGGILARGIEPSDRVAVLARNSFRYVEIYLACAHAGFVMIPINIRLAPPEIARILAMTETKFLFQSVPFFTGSVPTLAFDESEPLGANTSYEALVDGKATLGQAVESKPHDIAQVFFTSGTTGEPKGVCLTHSNLVASALDSILALELSADDVWLHAPPMFHLVDAFAVWAVSMVGGRHVITHFEPARFGALVEKETITKTSLPPTLLDLIARYPPLAEHDLKSLDRISYGGSPMPDAVYDRCSKALGCHLLQAYGITEVGGFVCQQFPHDLSPAGSPRNNSVGHPVLHIDLRIIDDEGRCLPPGKIGELVVAGPRVMAGYWRNSVATAAAIQGGVYRTGDLGIFKEGQYRIVGRKKDMIISGGENVYPVEVENALCAHSAVAEAAVFGIPSEHWGEEVCAIVALHMGCAATPEELIAHCRALIGGYKIPKRIDISPHPLPKSGPGKIAKHLIRANYLGST